jgi:hypothetical protein
MAATLWFHRSSGDDLLVKINATQVSNFVQNLYDTGSDRGLFQEMPLFNYKYFDKNLPVLTVPEHETHIFSDTKLQILLAPDGFQPPSYAYTRIFLTDMEAALHILTGLPSNFTKEEMEPNIINIESMEQYIFLATAPGCRYELPYREEPYDLMEPWKTEEQLDAELEKYMSTPVAA